MRRRLGFRGERTATRDASFRPCGFYTQCQKTVVPSSEKHKVAGNFEYPTRDARVTGARFVFAFMGWPIRHKEPFKYSIAPRPFTTCSIWFPTPPLPLGSLSRLPQSQTHPKSPPYALPEKVTAGGQIVRLSSVDTFSIGLVEEGVLLLMTTLPLRRGTKRGRRTNQYLGSGS